MKQNLAITKHLCHKTSLFCNVSEIILQCLRNIIKDSHSFHNVGKTSHNQSYFMMFVRHHERYLFHDISQTSLNQPTFCDI